VRLTTTSEPDVIAKTPNAPSLVKNPKKRDRQIASSPQMMSAAAAYGKLRLVLHSAMVAFHPMPPNHPKAFWLEW